MKAIVLAFLLMILPVAAHSDGDSELSWIFVLTAHNGNGALVAVDTEGPFASEAACKAVGATITRRVYEVIGSFQPDTYSALQWDKLTTSCEEVVFPNSEESR